MVWSVEGPKGFSVGVRSDGKRASRLEKVPDHPTATIFLSPDAYWRLGCGRITPEEVLARGDVRLEGDVDLGAAPCPP